MPEINSPVVTNSNTLSLLFKIDAIIALVAGVGIGLIALSGPVGVWLGLWNFSRGFDLLRITNSYAGWIAGIAFLVGVIIFIVALIKPIKNSLPLTGMALIGCTCAALAFYVPESFRPPEGTPPIHDITTDTLNPPVYVAIAPLRADASNSMEYGSGNNMTPERLADLQQSAYPDIIPQRFDTSLEQVFDRALTAVAQLGWELVDASFEERRIEATDTTFWFRFKDDIVITISREGNQTVLNARSLSRVGIGDVGKNAARLREFFTLL